ncbi:uncharacterized protein G2W53_028593 [Senna tora]|uniref:Uncharacterized protein n=1 Tax=Senna tora TaxID=362788 RepID=A0A834WEY1_9FABA|nr:uncharacterized protein G2W53_028593 [Senna tora]
MGGSQLPSRDNISKLSKLPLQSRGSSRLVVEGLSEHILEWEARFEGLNLGMQQFQVRFDIRMCTTRLAAFAMRCLVVDTKLIRSLHEIRNLGGHNNTSWDPATSIAPPFMPSFCQGEAPLRGEDLWNVTSFAWQGNQHSSCWIWEFETQRYASHALAGILL